MIDNWLQNPESMSTEAVEQLPRLIAQHPYCAAYRMLYSIALANTHSIELGRQLQNAACALPDRTQLFLLVNNGEHAWIELMRQLEQQRRDENSTTCDDDDFLLIDQFLSQQHLPGIDIESQIATVATDSPLDALAERPDLPSGSDADDDLIVSGDANDGIDQDSLIDQFLMADKDGKLLVPKADVPIENVPTPDPELIREKAFLTESLAKLYVKQHKFEQALTIFSQLNLQYSKKSGNFADQIRYLEKVISLQKELQKAPESKKINKTNNTKK